MLDVGSGTGKVLLHSSYFCPYNIGVELDLQSYFISAGMIDKCRSDRIALIHKDVAKLPFPFPELSDSSTLPNVFACCVFACIVGWSFHDMSTLRKVLDYSDQIKVVALCCRQKVTKGLDLKEREGKNGAIWEEHFSFPCSLHVSGESIKITIYSKKERGKFQKPISTRNNSKSESESASVHPLSLAFQLLQLKLSSHFHRFEIRDYLAFGEYGVCPTDWVNRVDRFLTFCSAKHSCGRIVEWNNNSCWMNSCLAMIFNQSIIRKMVIDSRISIPRRSEILQESNPDFVFKSMLMLMLVYCKNSNKEKSGYSSYVIATGELD